MNLRSVASLPDHALLLKLAELVSRERQTTAALLVHLGEVDARKLYLPAGHASMHVYCVHELHMSDDAAYKRIRVARLGRFYPAIIDALSEGRLHMSAVLSLRPHLSPGVVDELLAAATHNTRDEVERMLARRFPQPDLATMVRALPPPRASAPFPTPRSEPATLQLAPPMKTGCQRRSTRTEAVAHQPSIRGQDSAPGNSSEERGPTRSYRLCAYGAKPGSPAQCSAFGEVSSGSLSLLL